MLVAVLIKFGVKKQVPQVSFKIVARDLISFNNFGSDMDLFGSDMILFGSIFQVHEPSACSYSHQFWCEETSTTSLLQNCC